MELHMQFCKIIQIMLNSIYNYLSHKIFFYYAAHADTCVFHDLVRNTKVRKKKFLHLKHFMKYF